MRDEDHTGVLQGSQQMRQQTKILTLRSQNDQPTALEFRDIQLTGGPAIPA
ncbi:Uncharacterised protein [Escherichia coli]|uniref:Uncharacterized protein n=1 Tax=Escherichia coli TaxID=562 RepID=A0A376L202_ECOLX|nr:Uncharacterised protein [Escherichia coli]